MTWHGWRWTGADDVPGLLVCRLGVVRVHAAAVLEDYASKLEAPR